MIRKESNQVNIGIGISEKDTIREAWDISKRKSDPLIESWQERIRKGGG
jgi:hypothetical protein